MNLEPGRRIGNYEVLSPLGAGGMGEVYRGRDTRLDRIVAIKALPPALVGDEERLARFEREARVLASLNHPNIAGIHGIEDAGPEDTGGPYLVLEFVEGETLAQRLARGQMTIREAIEVGVQISSAIEAAHERGIVHRDLKPGNIMISPSRKVNVLDFGLAKGDPASDPSSAVSVSPTAAVAATAEGIILGTAPYMSPEQARGRPVDKRADVWAFGCVLMECVSGRPTFSGETVSDVIARILEREPDWSSFPVSAPLRLRDLIRRCLTKDVEQRPRDIGDLGRELSSIAMELSGASPDPTSTSTMESTPSLAVLYFENLAQDPESEYFCAGITEDILTDLTKIKGLKVASRNAVTRYRGAPVDIPRVAEDLGVGAVLEGSVRRAGDRVRITTQLINAADGFQIWGERFDRTLDDVFAVQDEIATSIVAALRVAMTPTEAEQLAQARPKDAQAYDLYLKGRQQYSRYREEAMREALDLFQQAIAIDSEYALAWAGVADCRGQLVQWGWSADVAEANRLGLEAARKAIAINPKLPEAHKAESLVLRNMNDTDGSRQALVRAIQADPRFTPALVNLAVDSFTRADLAAAERLHRRVLEIDPQDPFAALWLSIILLLTDRHDESMATALRAREMSERGFYVTGSWMTRASIHLARGDSAAAEETLGEALEDKADPTNVNAMRALIAARAGRAEEARGFVREVEQETWVTGASVCAAAAAAIRIGEPEVAVRLLDRQGVQDLAPCLARLDPKLHPILDREPLAPRRSALTLVWPLQAPMIDEARHALFREVRIESGKPRGSDILRGLADAS